MLNNCLLTFTFLFLKKGEKNNFFLQIKLNNVFTHIFLNSKYLIKKSTKTKLTLKNIAAKVIKTVFILFLLV